jgi:hypothetical protein
MQELAPQSKDGEYARPSYDLRGRIGSAEFPVRPCRQSRPAVRHSDMKSGYSTVHLCCESHLAMRRWRREAATCFPPTVSMQTRRSCLRQPVGCRPDC